MRWLEKDRFCQYRAMMRTKEATFHVASATNMPDK